MIQKSWHDSLNTQHPNDLRRPFLLYVFCGFCGVNIIFFLYTTNKILKCNIKLEKNLSKDNIKILIRIICYLFNNTKIISFLNNIYSSQSTNFFMNNRNNPYILVSYV